MKVFRIFLGAALVASLLLPSHAASGATGLSAVLSGDQEAPAGTGDPNGTGSAAIVLKTRAKQVCWNVAFEQIDNPTAGHIHEGDPGVDGDIIVPLFTNAAGIESDAQGCVKAPRRTIKTIKKNFTHFYVNLHNAAYPNGAIRGQLGYGE